MHITVMFFVFVQQTEELYKTENSIRRIGPCIKFYKSMQYRPLILRYYASI